MHSALECFMRAALAEGRKALPACLPNPPVGCVLVHNGAIIAWGYTNPPGHPMPKRWPSAKSLAICMR
jgi:pyrimidine deaminase RibD-like protein